MVNRYIEAIALIARVERLMIASGDTLVLALLSQVTEAINENIDTPDAQAA